MLMSFYRWSLRFEDAVYDLWEEDVNTDLSFIDYLKEKYAEYEERYVEDNT